MDTIINYLDNLFAQLPKSAKIEKVKKEMLSSMEEKYRELKASGKSENEAIGIVISEFGNIDELYEEFGVKKGEEKDQVLLSESEAKGYVARKKKSNLLVAIGVFLCIMSVASLIFVNQLVEQKILFANVTGDAADVIGLIPLFLLIAMAVALFIFSGAIMEKYEYIEHGVHLSTSLKKTLEDKRDTYMPIYTILIAVGVMLCILAPIALILISTFLASGYESGIGVTVLLSIIAVAVFIFIIADSKKSAYDILLGKVEIKKSSKKSEKVISMAAGIYWPLITIAYLLTSFLTGRWDYTWIIWAVSGILFGVFCTIINCVYEDKKS